MMQLTPMDWIRAALYNAAASGLTFDDVCRMSEHADTPQDFDAAINALAMATPEPTDAE